MKKKLKIFSIAFAAILLAGVGYLLYLFKFKDYDVADEEVDGIIEDPYTVELPNGSVVLVDENGELIEMDNAAEKNEEAAPRESGEKLPVSSNEGSEVTEEKIAGTTSSQSGGGGSGGTTDSKSGSSTSSGTNSSTNSSKSSSGTANSESGSPNKPTVGDIKNNYTATFEKLESDADEKLNSLVGRAKQEYSTKKENGESISYGYFYNKYMDAANALEAQTDRTFYGVVGAVEKDLEKNGYNKSYAQSFVDEYEGTKKARRDSLLNKALGRE